MRRFSRPPVLILALIALLGPATQAQAQVDQRALDQLGPAPEAEAPTVRPAAKPAAPPPVLHPNGPHQTRPPGKPRPATPPATAPGAPPAPVLPPPLVVPTRPIPAPSAPTVSADAPDIATKLPDGLRVTFGPDRADLNPAAAEALRDLVHGAPPGEDTNYAVTAYAAGSADDPSTPRRVSLERALAVRSVLIGQGVASVRIYVKALGALAPSIADGPPDRVDVAVSTPDRAAPASQKAAP